MNKIKEEFSSFKFKQFVEKAPKKHLTLLNNLNEEKFLNDYKDEVNKINVIEKNIESDLEEFKKKMEDNGNELVFYLEKYSENLPNLLSNEIDNTISKIFKDLFKCDINEDQTESFEQIQDKKNIIYVKLTL